MVTLIEFSKIEVDYEIHSPSNHYCISCIFPFWNCQCSYKYPIILAFVPYIFGWTIFACDHDLPAVVSTRFIFFSIGFDLQIFPKAYRIMEMEKPYLYYFHRIDRHNSPLFYPQSSNHPMTGSNGDRNYVRFERRNIPHTVNQIIYIKKEKAS